MSAFKGTPGPWEAHQRPASPIEYGHHVTTADGLTVCNVTYQLPARIDGEVVEVSRIANDRLIAAAPELLEALMQMVERISYYAELKEEGIPNIEDWAYTYNSGDMQSARAAIAKATGGAA